MQLNANNLHKDFKLNKLFAFNANIMLPNMNLVYLMLYHTISYITNPYIYMSTAKKLLIT